SIFKIEGDDYKRSKYPDQPKNLRAWLDKKSLHFTCHSADFNLLFSAQLADRLIEDFLLIQPISDFLCAVEKQKQAAQAGMNPQSRHPRTLLNRL
ncbi:MAG: hypothetical protein LBE62_08120, partial [Azonexus sp.]|nr:hypothetical protein [Azonexus sp.]